MIFEIENRRDYDKLQNLMSQNGGGGGGVGQRGGLERGLSQKPTSKRGNGKLWYFFYIHGKSFSKDYKEIKDKI